MKTFIDRLLRNPVSFEITSVFVYAFYCLVYSGCIQAAYRKEIDALQAKIDECCV